MTTDERRPDFAPAPSGADRPGQGDDGCRAITRITRLHLDAPNPYDFAVTVQSHGWVSLSPNEWDPGHVTLRRPLRLANGRVVLAEVGAGSAVDDVGIHVEVHHDLQLSCEEIEELMGSLAWMLRLDEDLTEFYQVCRERGGHWARLASGQGRLLRSPTLFEDVVRTILTTNVQWGGTVRMVRALVDALGEPFPGDTPLRAFPTPQAIATLPLETFTDVVRLGYRGPYIHSLALQIALGDLDLEALRGMEMPSVDLRKRLLAIKGVGPYAAATLSMILGQYDELAVDTEFRQFVRETYFEGQRVSDEEAAAVYGDWGSWKYLAYWFDLTKTLGGDPAP